MARYMKILVSVDTGEPVVTSVDMDAKGIETPCETPQVINPTDAFVGDRRLVGVVQFEHSSPGCVYWIGGRPVKVC